MMGESYNSKQSEQNSFFREITPPSSLNLDPQLQSWQGNSLQGLSFGRENRQIGTSFGIYDNNPRNNSGAMDLWKNLGQEVEEQQNFPIPQDNYNTEFRGSSYFDLNVEQQQLQQQQQQQQLDLKFENPAPYIQQNNNYQQIQQINIQSKANEPKQIFFPASGEQIASKFKPEIRNNTNSSFNNNNLNTNSSNSVGSVMGVLNSSLFAVNHAKSLYTNKISRLVDTSASPNASLSPHSSKSQQKYQRKISGRDKESEFSSNELNSHIGQLSLNDPQQIKLAKNRESARNSRNRKKIYVELLEAKVDEIEQELIRMKDICKKYETQLLEKSKNAQLIQQFMEEQQLLFDKLEKLLTQKKANDTEQNDIKLLIDALRYRSGSQTKERIKGVKNLLEEIIDLSLPVSSRYLLKSVMEQKDFFSKSQQNQFNWSKQIFEKIDLKPEQYQRIYKQYPKFIQFKQNIEGLIEQIQEGIEKLHYESSKIDQVSDQIFRELNPLQNSELLICLNQNGFRKEIMTQSIFKNMKSSFVSNEDENNEQFQIDIEEHEFSHKSEYKNQILDDDKISIPRKLIKGASVN